MGRFGVFVITAGVILAVPSSLNAWHQTYGGADYDEGQAVCVNTSGGYVATGKTTPAIWLLAVDSEGEELWSKTRGEGSGSSITQTADGGYIIAGVEEISWLGQTLLLLKTDAAGEIEWAKNFGQDRCSGHHVEPAGSGYIVAGSNEKFWVLGTNSGGDTTWTFTFGHSGAAYCVSGTSDGGYILTGTLSPTVEIKEDLCLVKLTAAGDTSWTRTFGKPDDFEQGRCVVQTSDGGFVICGKYGGEVWVMKTNSSGDSIWGNRFGNGTGHSLAETSDGGFIVTGMIYGGQSKYDLLVLKIDATGNQVWRRTYGGDNDEWGYCIKPNSRDGYIIAGQTNSFGAGDYDLWLIEIDANGKITAIIEGPLPDEPAWKLLTPTGSEIVLTYSGNSRGFHAGIHDLSGRKVDEIHAHGPGGTITWGDGFPAGIYFIVPENGYPSTVQKAILIR